MARVISTYYENDILITVYASKSPRKSEITFPNIKHSISNIGHKALALSNHGITKRKHG